MVILRPLGVTPLSFCVCLSRNNRRHEDGGTKHRFPIGFLFNMSSPAPLSTRQSKKSMDKTVHVKASHSTLWMLGALSACIRRFQKSANPHEGKNDMVCM